MSSSLKAQQSKRMSGEHREVVKRPRKSEKKKKEKKQSIRDEFTCLAYQMKMLKMRTRTLFTWIMKYFLAIYIKNNVEHPFIEVGPYAHTHTQTHDSERIWTVRQCVSLSLSRTRHMKWYFSWLFNEVMPHNHTLARRTEEPKQHPQQQQQ